MKRKVLVLFTVITLFSLTSIFAESTFYKQGDQKVTFNVGPTIPDFIYLFDQSHSPNFIPGFDVLKVGGYGAVNFDFFYNEKESLGIEVGYDFNYDNGDELYSNVPIKALYTFVPIQTGKWDLSLSAGLGISFNTHNRQTLISLLTSAKTNVSYFFNENWGIGLTAGFYAAPHFNYNGDLINDNGIIAYSPITLSLTYRN